jgi:hypothetical protein
LKDLESISDMFSEDRDKGGQEDLVFNLRQVSKNSSIMMHHDATTNIIKFQ